MAEGQLKFLNTQKDQNWGSTFSEVSQSPLAGKIFICHVNVTDLTKVSDELTKSVLDQSWIMELDAGARRAYTKTVAQTAEALVDVFKHFILNKKENKVTSEFGEIMVSMTSSRALEIIFSHQSLPISELWKPKLKGNEGFDFHTLCPAKLVNFGEAKFSSSKNPYAGKTGESTGAAGQADGFFKEEKHLRDRVYLTDLAHSQYIQNLDNDNFGAALSFSMNAKDPLQVYSKAVSHALTLPNLNKVKRIYLIGVSYES